MLMKHLWAFYMFSKIMEFMRQLPNFGARVLSFLSQTNLQTWQVACNGKNFHGRSSETKSFLCLQRAQFSFVTVAIYVFLSLYGATMARAENFDRLSDGRIAVSIKGNLFKLPSQGFDLNYIRFNEITLEDAVSLRQFIAASDEQRSALLKTPTLPISFGVGRDKSLFLGRFDRSQIENLRFNFTAGDDQRGCTFWKERVDRVLSKQPAVNPSEKGEQWNQAQSDPAIYVYSGTKLSNVRKGLTAIGCDTMSYCGSSICLAPNLGFSFQFSSKVTPDDQWAAFLITVDSIISHVVEVEESSKSRKDR